MYIGMYKCIHTQTHMLPSGGFLCNGPSRGERESPEFSLVGPASRQISDASLDLSLFLFEHTAYGDLESCQLLIHFRIHWNTKHLVVRRALLIGKQWIWRP